LILSGFARGRRAYENAATEPAVCVVQPATLRSLSEATNYDQPQVRILLGVLFVATGFNNCCATRREGLRSYYESDDFSNAKSAGSMEKQMVALLAH
jgi:hypothetical protein